MGEIGDLEGSGRPGMFLGHLDLLERPECPCRISEGLMLSGQYSVWFWFGKLEQLCADLKKKKKVNSQAGCGGTHL